ncbi:MAG: hypothetical protein D3903_02985 [Candidatus Electrothrix sp. GM3_4]|nr:hypothetical protein [Candidatus Electrothrix sp. GM3_4]
MKKSIKSNHGGITGQNQTAQRWGHRSGSQVRIPKTRQKKPGHMQSTRPVKSGVWQLYKVIKGQATFIVVSQKCFAALHKWEHSQKVGDKRREVEAHLNRKVKPLHAGSQVSQSRL